MCITSTVFLVYCTSLFYQQTIISVIIIFSNSVPINAPTNEAAVTRIVKEVKANNPQFQIRSKYS